MGLASRALPTEEVLPAASALALEIAACAPLAVAGVKQSLARSPGASLEDQLSFEAEVQAVSAQLQATRELGAAHRREERTLGFFLRTVRRFPYWGATSALVQVAQLDLVLLNLGLIDPVAHTNLFLNISLMRDPPPLVDQLRDATFDQLELLRELGRVAQHVGTPLLLVLGWWLAREDRVRDEQIAGRKVASNRAERGILHQRR